MAKARQPPPRLKVFRTAIGFHDAYVAAPSQAAALRAWGADANLFARGVAEVVSDPTLTAAPLARPGEVVKVARGTVAEHLAALPAARKPAKPVPSAAAAPKPRPKPKPKPDRAKLAAAEAALAALGDRHAAERRTLEQRQAAELARAQASRDRARDAYRRALTAWEG